MVVSKILLLNGAAYSLGDRADKLEEAVYVHCSQNMLYISVVAKGRSDASLGKADARYGQKHLFSTQSPIVARCMAISNDSRFIALVDSSKQVYLLQLVGLPWSNSPSQADTRPSPDIDPLDPLDLAQAPTNRVDISTISVVQIGMATMKKSATCLSFSPTIEKDNKYPGLYVGDKFGDVFRFDFDCFSETNSTPSVPSTLSGGTLVLGHISILTDMLIWSGCGQAGTAEQSLDPSQAVPFPLQPLLLTSDRDEKIRVSRLDRPVVIEAFMLEHTEYVSALCQCGEFVVSVGGDGILASWKRTGTIDDEKIELADRVDLSKLPAVSLQSTTFPVKTPMAIVSDGLCRLAVAFDQSAQVLMATINADGSLDINPGPVAIIPDSMYISAIAFMPKQVLNGLFVACFDKETLSPSLHLIDWNQELKSFVLVNIEADLEATDSDEKLSKKLLPGLWKGSLRKLRGDLLVEHRKRHYEPSSAESSNDD